MAEQKPEILQRKVGLLQTIAMITGLVIGAGIFGMVPTITGMTGPSVYLAFLIACLPSLFVVLYEIQLTGTLPVTGANYVTVTRILSPFWGGILSFAAVLALLAANILAGCACTVGVACHDHDKILVLLHHAVREVAGLVGRGVVDSQHCPCA